MNCSRCDAKAVVRRGEAVYCGKCAMARDWEEVIQFIQTERVVLAKADTAPAPAAADRPAGPDGMKTRPARKPEPAAQTAAAEQAPAQAPAESNAVAAPPSAPPADPFG